VGYPASPWGVLLVIRDLARCWSDRSTSHPEGHGHSRAQEESVGLNADVFAGWNHVWLSVRTPDIRSAQDRIDMHGEMTPAYFSERGDRTACEHLTACTIEFRKLPDARIGAKMRLREWMRSNRDRHE